MPPTDVIRDGGTPIDLGLKEEYKPKKKESLLDIDKDEMKVEDWERKTLLE